MTALHPLPAPSGSKPGERRGGRQKGTPNIVTADRAKALSDAANIMSCVLNEDRIIELSPLDIMLIVMRIHLAAGNWVAAAAQAEKADPYVHAKLHTTSIDATVRRNASDFTDEELLALANGGEEKVARITQ